MNNKIANMRAVQIWVKEETTPGTLVYPAASDAIAGYDITYPNQVPEYENSQERANTRDVIDRCQGKIPPGEYGFTTDVRPAGAGVVPAENVLLRSLCGKSTLTPVTDVVFEPALTKPSFSLWLLADHTMYFCSGATVGEATLTLENCPLSWQWSGMFMKMGICGTDGLDVLVSASDTDIQVKDTDKFNTNGMIVLKDSTGAIVDDNGGAGYTITAVTDGVSITVTPAIVTGVAVTGEVAPFNPGHTVPGNRLESRTAVVNFNGTDKAVADFTFTVTDQPEYLDRERTPSNYPESYAETQREVGGEIRFVYREDDAVFFKQAMESTKGPIILTVGDIAGYQLVLTMGNAQLDMPVTEEVDPLLELVAPYMALATSGEDSYDVTYQ